MAKKVISIICAFSLMLSLFSLLTAVSFATSPDDCWTNDFETTSSLCGGTWYTPDTVDDYDSGNVHRGNGSIRFTYKQSDWYTYESDFTLKAGKKYKVSFWYKTSVSSGSPFYFNLKSMGTNNPCEWGSASTTWKRGKAVYTPTVDDKFVIKIYSSNDGGLKAGSYIYFDDIVIAETSANADFELETTLPLFTQTSYQYYNGTWYTPNTVADYDSNNVHSGSGSLRYTYKQSDWQYIISDYALKEGRTYKFTFWYKTSASSGNAFYLNYWCGPDSKKNEYFFAATEWTKVEKTFTMHDTSGQNRDNYFFIKLYPTSDNGPAGGSFVYFDDMVVSEVSNSYTMTVNQSSNGTASVDKTSVDSGGTVTFTATPSDGYLFEKWVDESGNKVADQRIYTVSSVSKSLTLTPVFIADSGCTGIIDFETPNSIVSGLSSSGKWYTSTISGYDSSNVYGGTKSFCNTYPNTAWNSDITIDYTLKSGTTYKISLWYKGPIQLGFIFNDTELVSEQIYQTSGSTWQQKAFTYTATTDTTLKLRKYCINSNFYGKTFYLDDIKIVNNDDIHTCLMAVNQSSNGTASVDKSSVDSGDTVTFTATPNNSYLFEKWVDESGNKVADQKTYVISSVSKSLTLTPVFIKDTGCNGVIDFETPNSIVSGPSASGKWYTETIEGYDSANVHGGTKSFCNTYPNTAWNSDITIDYTLKSGTTYKISLWYKGPVQLGFIFNGTELATQQIWQTSGDTWQQKTFSYTATSDTTLKLRKYCISSSFYGKTFYLDDIEVIPYDDSNSYSMAVTQSEHGKATVSADRVIKGSSVKFEATADAGYTLEKWVDEGGNKVADQNPYVIAKTTKSLKLTPVYIEKPDPTAMTDFESVYYFDTTGGYNGGAVWYTPTYADVGGYDSKNVHGGNNSLVYKVSKTQWDAYTSGIVMKKDTTYKVSFWFKSTSSKGMVAYYGLSQLISQDSKRNYLSASSGWQKVTAYYTPSQDDVFRMKFYSGNDGGLAENTLHFFDDFCVEEFTTPKTQEVKFDEEIPTTNFFSWNTNTKFTRNGSKGSLKFDGVNSKGALNDQWDPTSGKHAIYTISSMILESNTQYTVSFWYYNPNSTSGELQLNFTGNYIGFVGASLKQAVAGWKQCSITFQTGNGSDSSMFFVGRPDMIFYIDDLLVQMNDKVGSYCEPLFNLIKNGDIEEEISDDNFVNLPSWITRNKSRNESAASNGGYYLTVDAKKGKGSKYILPITIPKSGKYVFGVSMKANLPNNVKVYIVDDIDKMSINKLMSEYQNNFVCTQKNNGKYERLSFRMTFNTAKTIYLVIQGDSGTVDIDAIQLFQLKYTKENDQGDYRIIKAFNFDTNGVSPDSDVSPLTGYDNEFRILFIVFLSSIVALCGSLIIKKVVSTNE